MYRRPIRTATLTLGLVAVLAGNGGPVQGAEMPDAVHDQVEPVAGASSGCDATGWRSLVLPGSKATLADLAFLLKLAQGNAAGALAPGIELRVVAHRVSALEPGVYRYERDSQRLALVRSGDLRVALRRACGGQEKAASAAVGFAMLADLQAAAPHGDRAYRDLLLESGAIAQRLYLAAEARGLAARNLAAFFDDSLNGLLGVDGKRAAVVHLTMVGPGN